MLDAVLNFLSNGLSGAGWVAMLVYVLVMTQLTIFTVTLYLHRSQTHRGVDFHPALANFFRFWGWLTTGMVVKEWVAVHRKHHAKVETEEDPHSPQIYGIKKVFWDGVSLYRDASYIKSDLEKYGRGTPDDWIERKLFGGHPYWGPTLMLLIDLALFGVIGAAIWAVQMIWIPFWAAGFVNGIGHWWGYRNFESADTATNLSPWGVWIGGEELHNNHHAFPSSAKFALRKWEFDIGWAVICGLRAVGLAKVMRVAPTLDIRPNVHLPDAETLKAVLTHRFQAMTDYYRGVIVPTLRDEAQHAGESLKAMPRRMRRALADGGRWLDHEGRERLQAALAKRPTLRTVCDFRTRLADLMEQRGAEQSLKGLQQWIAEAEQSGIRVLQDFAQRLKGYAVSGAH
ncbi:fatty acid desaturase [Dyella marensis]|jgi:stearoyl-CoA desaturase (delta-9 desaturase)|uniref:Stearoyl-CoA desaturase (Delta-9 desaturase) n=1 Tax=Dyella marensis TaxID=500610 RepID=A0A1I2ENH8_9GAMM|nr:MULTISPECIES: fatty acid desaturase [Dyella]SFE94664.1 stearoyl-CoA desaturase (delta-9 desaturase) [Dyella marensis]